MDWKETYRAELAQRLDPRGDIAPPWEQFPDYERLTIGWRMGAGEGWLGLWSVFLDQLAPDLEARLAYLRRHPPAPVTWADSVYRVLHPGEEEDDDSEGDDEDPVAAARRAELLELGLLASDIAFTTWLGRQKSVRWPWERHATPEIAARYDTRELWFWSRQITLLRGRGGWTAPAAPEAWGACIHALATGDAGLIDPREGLLSLARMLSAGLVEAPWQLALTPADFADTFADDMGYVDAFRLWGMSSFDDAQQLRGYLDATHVPSSWEPWIAEHLAVD